MAPVINWLFLVFVILKFYFPQLANSGLNGDTLAISLTKNGQSYLVYANGEAWLQSSATYFKNNGHIYSTADNTLKFSRSWNETGQNKWGLWYSICFEYLAGNVTVGTYITEYKEYPHIITFTQSYLNEAVDTTSETDGILSAFPNFKVGGIQKLGYLAFGGNMAGFTGQKIGLFEPSSFQVASGRGGGPIVFFNKSAAAMIVAPVMQFMDMSPYHDYQRQSYGWGVMGGVKTVPTGFTCATMMYFSSDGIEEAFEGWGEVLRYGYNKPSHFRGSDLTINYLSYWTDNGAYYVNYYEKPPYLIQNRTYEEAMLDTVEYANTLQIPYRSLQYSVWFQQGADTGDKQWDANPALFASGMRKMFEATGLPATAHNRWWANDTVYAEQNGGPYKFIIEKIALPQDQDFWNYIFAHSRLFGFQTLMQDWLDLQFESMEATTSTVDIAKTWLIQMGNGAAQNGMTIQYCMSLSRHILQSIEIPAVTQARVSADYVPGKEAQWQIGVTSMFTHVLGVAPFKDTFWTTSKQPGNFYQAEEPCPALHAAVATLSMGPVGPGDMVNGTDKDLLMRCCRTDGLILKPSRPAFASSLQLLTHAFTQQYPGELWTTYSMIGDQFAFGIVFAADLRTSFTVYPKMLFANRVIAQQAVYTVATYSPLTPRPVTSFTHTNPLVLGPDCTLQSFCLYYTTPVFSINAKEVVLLGELNKWVTLSSQRIKDIIVTSNNLTVHISLVPHELMLFYVQIDGVLHVITCSNDEGLDMIVNIMNQLCVVL